jgi:hypothetical protein
MINIRDKLWLLAIIAGALGVISLLAPAWSLGSAVGWLWNLYSESGEPGFVPPDEELFTLGMIATIMIIVGTVLTLISGILSKFKDKEILIMYIIGGALMITGIIIYMAGASIVYGPFWRYYIVSVGAIFPYIGGALGIFAGVIGIMENRS